MSQYKDQSQTYNKENIGGASSQNFPFRESKKTGKINWDKEVDFVFEEMKKDQQRRIAVNVRRGDESNVYTYQ